MTVWAFVSDVHGNRRALALAEQIARAAGADRFVSLGDVVGRGDPDGCVTWVRDNATIAIVGNRDLDYVDRVSPELQAVVRAWPHEARASDFVVSHGDPHLHRRLNSGAERDSFRRAGIVMAEQDARVWLFGHTHRSRGWALQDGEVHPLDPGQVTLRPDCRYAINVGTTGLPLPGRGAAALVLYDDGAGVIRSLPLVLGRREAAPEPHAIISEAMQEVR
jgi:predicted phosphodiesterase